MIELGSGVGLLGCVMSGMCDSVTLTDHHSSVLQAASHTAAVNHLQNVGVRQLDWTKECSVEPDDYDIVVAAGKNFRTSGFHKIVPALFVMNIIYIFVMNSEYCT